MPRARVEKIRLASLLRQFPAVTVLGPRQIGKSTLAKWALPGFEYFDLEHPDHVERLRRDPVFALTQSRRIILDEAQRMPELFPVLRSLIDQRPGSRFVILGSASPELSKRISESLTGRVGVLELSGISIFEHPARELWLRGGFPRVHWSRPRAKPEDWYPAYLRTSLEQDVPQLGFRLPAERMRTLLTMIGHVQGGICNLSELGSSLGVSYHAVDRILDVLEGLFLVRRLRPYFANIGKRLVKSPKVYVRDTGLLHALLRIPFDPKALLAHPKAGPSFESFCIEQIVKHARLADPQAEAHFFRTHAGAEVDLLLTLRGELIPIEVKLGSSIPSTRGLESCMADLQLVRGFVVTAAAQQREIGRGLLLCGLEELLDTLGLRPRRARA